MSTAALVRLLQLASPALPVGAYTYSEGLEWAVEAGRVRDEAGAAAWIGQVFDAAVASFEAPLLARMMAAWNGSDIAGVRRLNEEFVASRETAELRAETLQMGFSLARLLRDLGELDEERLVPLLQIDQPAYPAVWSFAACAWSVAPGEALTAYLWSWMENQVMAAVKLVPLGQSAGQRLLSRLGASLPAAAARALTSPDADLSNFAPGLAIACSRHETQYTRLFRS